MHMKWMFVVACLAAGCSSTGNQNKYDQVDNSMLQYVPESKMAPITDARTERDKANDTLAAAQRRTQQAHKELELAQQERAVAEAEVKKAALAVDIAQKGTQAELDRAKVAVEEAKTLPTAVKARITWRERELDRAKAEEDLAVRDRDLGNARVQVAEAREIKKLDRPEARNVNVETCEAQFRDAQETMRAAKTKADEARRAADLARTQFDETAKIVPANFRKNWEETDKVIGADKDGTRDRDARREDRDEKREDLRKEDRKKDEDQKP